MNRPLAILLAGVILAGARLTSPAHPRRAATARRRQPDRRPKSDRAARTRSPRASPPAALKGAHDDYYRASREGVWPWYKRSGPASSDSGSSSIPPVALPASTTMPIGSPGTRASSIGADTRDQSNASLGGDGARSAEGAGIGPRAHGIRPDRRAPTFCKERAPTLARCTMPGLAEKYERVEGSAVS